ncbi:MAG: hypothetical protein IKE73_02120 [Bacilli bacterium]|nr:hypothetical protein [Bacilli bacterium]
MKQLNLSYDRIRQLLETCTIDQLDSLDILLSQVKSYDLDIINSAFINIMREKYDKYKSELEGMRSYDDITRIANFDVSTIPDYDLYQCEKIFLKKLMEDAIKNINETKNPLYLGIVPNIEEALNRINYSLNDLYNIGFMMSDEELEIMFNKFDAIEIKSFNNIFETMDMYNTENMIDIANKVYKEKTHDRLLTYDEAVKKYCSFDIIDLSTKKKELSENELKFLCDILEESFLGLMHYKKYNDIKSEKYDKLEVSLSNLLESYKEELDARNIYYDNYDDDNAFKFILK